MSPQLDLAAIQGRYSAALDARPSKGAEIGSDGYTALTDAVADIPGLIAACGTAQDLDTLLARAGVNQQWCQERGEIAAARCWSEIASSLSYLVRLRDRGARVQPDGAGDG